MSNNIKEVFMMWDTEGDNALDVVHFAVAFRAAGLPCFAL